MREMLLSGPWRLAGLILVATAGMLAASFGFGGAGNEGAASGSPAGWRIGEPVSYENMTIFPILAKVSADTSGFETLDEGLSSGDVVIQERGGGGLRRTREGQPIPEQSLGSWASVNQLVLINRGKRPVILLAGELVSGGKQDRIIGRDRIVPVGADPLPLNVFCVEHGRWSSGDHFTAGKTMVHPSVRGAAAVDQQQAKVWSAVTRGTTADPSMVAPSAPLSSGALAGVISSDAPSESYRKIYQSQQVGGSVSEFAEQIRKRFAKATANLKGEQVVGVVIAFGGEVAWGDAFASADLFQRYWSKLLESYVVEALARGESREHVTLEDAREFLQATGGRETTESEPGVYRWSERSGDHLSEIELESLRPGPMVLHWLKIHRTS